jgi:hypothetical protein
VVRYKRTNPLRVPIQPCTQAAASVRAVFAQYEQFVLHDTWDEISSRVAGFGDRGFLICPRWDLV